MRQLEFVHAGDRYRPGDGGQGRRHRGAAAARRILARGAAGLTQRESEILSYVVNGLSNRGIATKLVIGDETVKSHLRSIYRKLGVSDRAERSPPPYGKASTNEATRIPGIQSPRPRRRRPRTCCAS